MIIQGNERPECFSPNHGAGAICIASGELSRYPAFTESVVNLLRPTGTTIQYNCGSNISANFNCGIRDGLSHGAEWIWILGDDHEFESDTLLRLLERKVDIIVPLVMRRQPPFIPVLFKDAYAETPAGQFPPFHWSQLPRHGLLGPEQGLRYAGSAGMLIRRSVLDKMSDPWFEMGKLGTEYNNEDVYFCKKAREAGFEIYADMDVQLDHWTPMSLRPVRTHDQWAVAINLSPTAQAILPPKTLSGLTHVPDLRERTKERFYSEKALAG
jgi:hypothetical protein